MELILERGRPESNEGRQEREIRCYDLLDSLGIDFYRVDHAEAHTMEDCAAADKLLGDDTAICKNLFLRNSKGDQYFLLMLPGEKHVKTKEVAKQIGSTRLSFGEGEKMEEFLDIHPGAVSVMGLMNDKENRVQLLMDEDVLKLPFVGCHPCMSTSSIKLSTDDLMEKFLPAVSHDVKMVTIHEG